MSRVPPREPTEPRETAAEIDEAAAAWVARRDRAPLSRDEEEDLRRWGDADPRRAGAYARAMAVNLHLNRVAALGENYSVVPEPSNAPTRRSVIAAGISAVAATAVGLGLFDFGRRNSEPVIKPIATAKGAVRQLKLQEGTRVTLNTMTQIRPSLTARLRRIDLLQGEALFDVVSDPARPFIVFAGDISVRAVGTSFTVHRIGLDAIKVLVTEGVVEVSRDENVLGRVHAGIEFAINALDTPVITNLDASQLSSALAWREGRIDLQGFTLAQAVAEFSRYSDIKIEVKDPSIAGLHITGVYATSDPAGFARDAALSLGLKSRRRGNGVTISRT